LIDQGGTGVPSSEFAAPREALERDTDQAPPEMQGDLRAAARALQHVETIIDVAGGTVVADDFAEPADRILARCKDYSTTDNPQPKPSEARETTPPPPPPVQVKITCYGRDGEEDPAYSDPKKAWSEHYGEDDCDSPKLKGRMSAVQRKAVRKAFTSKGDNLGRLTRLYDLCAQNDPDAYWDEDLLTLSERSAVLDGMLILCPKHPQSKKIRKAQREAGLVKAGRLFNDGRYRVGKEIKPGHYVAHPEDEGCYWERLDRDGNIKANLFTNGSRVAVNISSSDYDFRSENCGTWR
jgi:hypothetical protein